MKALAVLLLAALTMSCRKAKPPATEGAYVAAVGKAQADPKASKPTAAVEGKDATVYTFAPPPGLSSLKVTVAKTPAAPRRVDLTAAPGQTFAPGNFAQASVSGELPSEWFDLPQGPLKGMVLHLPGFIGSIGTPGKATTAEIYTPSYFLTPASAFENRKLMRWACSSGGAGVKGAITASEFLSRCDDAREKSGKKGTFFGLGTEERVLVSADCDLAIVTSDNGKSMACNYTAKTGKVDAR